MNGGKIEISQTTVDKILTRTQEGFLKKVSSHSLQPYRGCTFGNTLCGAGCYVQSMRYVTEGREWGKVPARRDAYQRGRVLSEAPSC